MNFNNNNYTSSNTNTNTNTNEHKSNNNRYKIRVNNRHIYQNSKQLYFSSNAGLLKKGDKDKREEMQMILQNDQNICSVDSR